MGVLNQDNNRRQDLLWKLLYHDEVHYFPFMACPEMFYSPYNTNNYYAK